MNQIEDMILVSAKIAKSVALRTGFFVIIGGLIALVLWIMLLPLLGSCGLEGTAAVKCVVVFVSILFLAFICPFLFFWFGKNYALSKAIFGLYGAYKDPVLNNCATKICAHKNMILKSQKFKQSQLFKEFPFFIRMALRRIDFSFLVEILKSNPNISPAEMKIKLETYIQKKDLVKKPRATFFWVILGLMLLLFFGLKHFI